MILAGPAHASGPPRHRLIWLHVAVIAALMISRRPDAVLHPQFWGEDGQVFYHDAYTIGLSALITPLGGYLNTFSRLVAAFTVHFPLGAAPGIYAAFALAAQLLPVVYMLSRRLDAALPSWPARLAISYFYAVMPNSYELNINLTDAQWHLALVAFLIVAGTPAAGRLGVIDDILLLLSGLSGPFGIFLLPIVAASWCRDRDPGRLRHLLIVAAAAAVQLGLILASHATSARVVTPLGASIPGFIRIVTYQIVLAGLLGSRGTYVLVGLPFWHQLSTLVALALAELCLVALALRIGPVIYRQAAFWSAAMFAAALITPLSSTTIPQWVEMTHIGASIRYYAVPTLVSFATTLIIMTCRWPLLRSIGYLLLTITLFGIRFDWPYPPYYQTDFAAQAQRFAAASPGTTLVFPENPVHWAMVLTKR